jgi:hypothetical protein
MVMVMIMVMGERRNLTYIKIRLDSCSDVTPPLNFANNFCLFSDYIPFHARAGIGQSVYRLATGWTTERSGFESR